ncbi:hypothetical protein LAZ67_1001615 [Cordylochernes scorpioides]|uniref:Pro-Pol polyprotein n=1 Tax=Cordylochernes scorpioides TaxID=51811 RepID=A0ABY6JWC6_9ARAC|nr:hypothetical protein LAZ67_1001615 [Cordylochernes scorpioides]
MEEMDALKKRRKAIRGTFTRIINEINGEFEKSQIDRNDIYSKFNRLESYYTKLVDLNEKYQALLVVKEGITEESIDKEWQECDKYEEEKFDIQQKVSVLRNPDKEETIPIASEDTVINVKLPELALKSYDGSLEGWLPWWAQFSKIHENKNLSDSDRFLYLRQAIVPNSEAYRVVASYPVTGANYVLAVQALQERFGDPNILTELYVRRLLNSVISNVKKENRNLSSLYDELSSHLRSLETLGIDPQLSDKGVGGAQERLRLLLDFLKAEVRSAQRLKFVEKGFKQEEPYKRSYNDGTRTRSNFRPATVSSLFGGRTNIKCFFCERTNHASHQCRSIMKMSPGERNDKIRSAHLCFKCLRKGHIQSQCREQLECKNCGRNHLEVLCEGNSSNRLAKPGRENLKENAPEPIASLSSQACTGQVLLMTTVALLRGPNASRRVRILLDSGSQFSYIKQSLVWSIGIERKGEITIAKSLFGGNKIGEEKHGKFMLELENLGNKRDVIHIGALDQRKICDAIPPLPKGDWLEKLKIKGIILSQDNFKGQEIDILIGANYLGMILTGKIVQVEADLTAVETKLGWTLMGNSPIIDSNDNVQQTLNLLTTRCDLKDLWDLEVLGIRDPVETCSKETRYQEIKEKFITKIQRQSDQRYSVGLPWKVEKESIPSNLDIAIKRLDISTKKMTSQNKLTEYSQIFRDWLTEGLIERVEENPLERRGYYLPHRPVYKMESKTTPIRPVFDASCLGHNGLSLNQCLEKGPNLLERIPEMMIRFRESKFGVTADIRKAFQMVAIEESERNYLRFLWWEKESDRELIAYRHKRLVFGLNCSPFVLNAVIEYHLQSIRGPLGPFYMDNCITSLETKQEVQEFQKAAIEIMDRAKMDLREWEYSLEENPEKGTCAKILGVVWNKMEDSLKCELPDNLSLQPKLTKRLVLSMVQRIFDPLGFCAPVFLPPKLLLQRSWGLKLGWDTPLPESMAQEFRTWLDQIKLIELIKIPRYMWNDLIFPTEVHIFCDASQIGYGAVAYLRSETERENTLTLIWSKVRLAPMKSITIPRLELMAMVLGARLANAIQAALKRKCETTLWSDSTTALSWIKKEIEWRVFVRNRVREIQATTNLNDWRFVPSQLNPADLLSRGCPPSQFVQSRWWEGPEWLKKPKEFWPNSEFSINPKEINVEENIMKTNINLNIDYKDWILTRRSDYSLNIRVMSYVLRFLGKLKKQSTETGPLKVSELDLAEKKLIRMIQEKVSIEKSNGTKSLKKLKNTDGLWCVESKLLHGQVPEEFKTPIILPGDHPFVEQLIWEVHLKNGHVGVQFILSKLREKFWIIRGRKTIKKIITLPENRIGLGKPFQVTGVDLLGPLHLKEGGKVWVAAFTCAVYRAIHLELVKSLETGVFMMALHRFICRRGRPEKIYSDNGTNFAKLNRIFKRLDWTRIERETSIKRIQWIFIPPSAPWWGGFWERMVRTIKEMLIKMLGHRKLKYVQLQTALCEIESIINNRPLTYVSEEDNDLKPLTPNEFLQNGPESSFPEFENLKPEMLHTRYRELGQLKRELKQRFLKEYLGALIQKSKNIDRRQLKVGDVVLIGQENLKRMFWPKGRIVNLIPGKDGIVRVAHVKTSTGTLIRALQRLHPLEISSNVETIQKDNSNTEPQSEAFFGNRPNIESRDSRNRYGREIKDLESRNKSIVESKNIHRLKLFQQEVNERKISLNQIVNTLLESELDETQYEDYSKAKDDIFNMLVSIEEALSLIETKENTHSDKQLPESNVNLPKINLPIFNGDSANWLSFREIFNSTINSNQTLTEIQKFQYLNASVKGPAEKLIRGFPISDRNYQQAWDTLCNRFNNRRELAFSQINKIFSIRPLKSITTGSLYEILDVCNEGIRNLSVLGLEKNTLTDLILINFFEKRIGEALRKEWELTLKNEEYPTFENFVKFLEKHARSLQGMRIPLFQEQKTSSKNMMAHGLYVNKGQNCILCHQIHKLNDCHRFINLPLPKKWELVKKHKLCQNCLRANHEISKCLITSRCKNCKQNHHTLLHEYNSEPSIPQPTTSQEMLISTNTICNVMPLETETNILLSTALIKVKAKDGSFVLCRALVDNGSQICLISEQCCHNLGLEKMKNSYTLKGVGDIVVNRTTSQVEIEFTPHHNDQLFSARAFVVGRVTADLPNFQIQSADFPHLENLLLADPEFYVTKPIDLILGADTFVEIILGHKTDLEHHPIALNTKLGWLVSGRIHSNIKSKTSVINHCTTELDSSIRKFWELEDVPISKAQLGTKNACEILFKSDLKRDIEGRYSVNLPFKSTPNLGDSRSQALRRFFNLEKRLQANPSLKSQYINFMREYMELNHMELIPLKELKKPSNQCFYLPHHGVLREQLWKRKTSWDEPIESDIKSNWNKFQTQLSCLKEIKIPRYLNSSSSEIEELQLHGFCDASLNAYSAVVYLKTRFKNQKIKIILITSKTKVAPLKTITIPRLELSAALLLAQLNQVILESFPFQPDKTFLWTDSQICIDWIRSDASRWKAFVSNRVSSIQNLTQITDWFHVSSQDNPADCASRGIMPQDLVNHRIWWRGPIWLQENNVRYIPSSPTQVNLNIIQEEVGEGQVLDQTTLIQNSETILNLEFIERYSTMTKLIRITAWCWRFYYNCLLFDPIRQKGPLTTRELTKAIQVLVKSIQQVEFCTEIKLLKSNKQLPLSNKLTSLNPFLDTQGLLRVRGRLKYSYLNENQKFPLLLPKNHHITNLIIDDIHRKYLHAGPQLVLSILGKNYWILGARDAVKKIIKKCLICLKFKSTTIHQIMGNLPPERIIPSRPFSKTGIDLTGPFLIKRSLGRSKTISKSYIVLFICFTTKAIHLELTTSLSTDSFMALLRRFMARRGKPSDIYSDNATNFKGASNFFRTQFQLLNSQSVQRLVTEELITWHFIPPGGPHFGGLWEAGIKSVKSHLVRTFKSTTLNYEEMNTLIIQIESCLNSRVTLDPSLTYGPHINQTVLRAKKRLNILKRISGYEWGADRDTLRQTYLALIRPILEYAQPVWQTASKTNLNKIDQVQSSAARIICGLRNTCPTKIAEIEANLLPLTHRRKIGLADYIYKRVNAPKSHRTGEFIRKWKPKTRLKRLSPMHLAYRELLPNSTRNRNAQNQYAPYKERPEISYNLDLEQECSKRADHPGLLRSLAMERIEKADKETIQIYTDGSLVENGSSGSGVLILKDSMEIKRRIKNPKNLSVFRSELTAILQALKLVEKNETKNIIIYTDSKAAIFAIKNCYYSQDRLLKNIAAEINKLNKNTKIGLQWIPSHVGVPGNEEADRLAKEGAAGHPDAVNSETYLSARDHINKLKLQLIRNHRDSFHHSWYQAENPKKQTLQLNRRESTQLARWKSGHLCPLIYKEGAKSFPMCTRCKTEEATPQHLLNCIGKD